MHRREAPSIVVLLLRSELLIDMLSKSSKSRKSRVSAGQLQAKEIDKVGTGERV